LGPEGDLLAQGQADDLTVEYVPQLRRAIHPWRDIRSLAHIKRILREFQPDVVHTHSAKGGMLGRMAATSLKVPAVIHTVHGAPFHPYQGRGARALFRWCERYAAGKCHVMVSVAEAMTDLLVEAGVAPRDKFVTIYSGMDVEPFLAANDHRDDVRRELGFSDEHIVIGKIARLFHLKGHEYLVDAAQAVVASCPRAKFLLVGDGILRESLQRQLADAGLTDYFCFTGLVPPNRIPALLGAMDVLVHTSLREGLARALPQALIAGKPVVSYDVDGAREVVIDHQTGRLLPPRSIDELSEALIELCRDANLRDRLGSAGRQRFTDQFRHETMTARLRELYARLLAANRPSRPG
jgi:glycosyltransferase involved in cell wall biosynthesis